MRYVYLLESEGFANRRYVGAAFRLASGQFIAIYHAGTGTVDTAPAAD